MPPPVMMIPSNLEKSVLDVQSVPRWKYVKSHSKAQCHPSLSMLGEATDNNQVFERKPLYWIWWKIMSHYIKAKINRSFVEALFGNESG